MSKKFITIDEARTLYLKFAKEYVSQKFDGELLIKELPEIDFATIFGSKKRMDAQKVGEELKKILIEQIK